MRDDLVLAEHRVVRHAEAEIEIEFRRRRHVRHQHLIMVHAQRARALVRVGLGLGAHMGRLRRDQFERRAVVIGDMQSAALERHVDEARFDAGAVEMRLGLVEIARR